MLFEIIFNVGGTPLVNFFDSILGPLFEQVCSNADKLGGLWVTLATVLEMLLS